MYEITITVDTPEQTRVLTYLSSVEYQDEAWNLGRRIAGKLGYRSPHVSIHTNPIKVYSGIAEG